MAALKLNYAPRVRRRRPRLAVAMPVVASAFAVVAATSGWFEHAAAMKKYAQAEGQRQARAAVEARRHGALRDFDAALAGAQRSVTEGRFDNAYVEFERARAAAIVNLELFTPAEIRSFNSALTKAHQVIREAEQQDRARQFAEERTTEAARRGHGISALIRKAEELRARGERTEAAGVIEQVLILDPGNPDAVRLRGQ